MTKNLKKFDSLEKFYNYRSKDGWKYPAVNLISENDNRILHYNNEFKMRWNINDTVKKPIFGGDVSWNEFKNWVDNASRPCEIPKSTRNSFQDIVYLDPENLSLDLEGNNSHLYDPSYFQMSEIKNINVGLFEEPKEGWREVRFNFDIGCPEGFHKWFPNSTTGTKLFGRYDIMFYEGELVNSNDIKHENDGINWTPNSIYSAIKAESPDLLSITYWEYHVLVFIFCAYYRTFNVQKICQGLSNGDNLDSGAGNYYENFSLNYCNGEIDYKNVGLHTGKIAIDETLPDYPNETYKFLWLENPIHGRLNLWTPGGNQGTDGIYFTYDDLKANEVMSLSENKDLADITIPFGEFKETHDYCSDISLLGYETKEDDPNIIRSSTTGFYDVMDIDDSASDLDRLCTVVGGDALGGAENGGFCRKFNALPSSPVRGKIAMNFSKIYDHELEYIEATGTQWIELPIKPNEATDAIEFTFKRSENVNQHRFCRTIVGDGVTVENSVFDVYVNNNGRIAWNFNNAWTEASSSNNALIGTVKHTLKVDYKNGKITYDYVQFSKARRVNRVSDYNLRIFCGAAGGTTPFKGRIYGCKYWRDEVLVFDLIPVRKNGTGYLYNKIDGKLYGNSSGTGEYVLGYDKLTSLLEYETLDYIENNVIGDESPYINTEIEATSGLSATMTVKWNHRNAAYRQLMGCNNGAWFGCDKGVYRYNSETIPATDSFQTVTVASLTANSNKAPFALFNLYNPSNRGMTERNFVCTCKLKAFSLTKNNVLLRDFVPVRHPAGIIGLFDRVEHKFFPSANDGVFTYESHPEIIEVEYLRNEGNVHIDTGIFNHKRWGMGCTFTPSTTDTTSSGWKIFCGSRTTFYYSLNWTESSKRISICFDYMTSGGLGVTNGYEAIKGEMCTAETRCNLTNSTMDSYFNGNLISSYTLPADATQGNTIWLFDAHDYRNAIQDIAKFWVTDTDGVTKLADLIPVRIGDTGYMYDKLSGVLFGKCGSGYFNMGADKYTARVEYLQGSTSTWIDSGIRDLVMSNSDWELEIKGTVSNSSIVTGTYMKGHGYVGTTNSLFFGYSYQNAEHIRVRTTNIRVRTTSPQIINMSCKNGTLTSKANGSTISTITNFPTFTLPYFYLFAYSNDSGSIPGTCIKTTNRIYSCKIYVGGVKKLDLIPVRLGNVGYLFDRVKGKLHGSPSGTFTRGVDLYDAPVEYLQGTGNTYIDTGVNSTHEGYFRIDLVDYFNSSHLGIWPFGGRDGYQNNELGMYINANTENLQFACGNSQIAYNNYSTYPESCTVEGDVSNGTLKVGTTEHTFTPPANSFSSSNNIILFGLNNGGSIIKTRVKIGNAYVYNGSRSGTRNYIPVRCKNIGYMYDKFSGNLVGNTNTETDDTFILGNDIYDAEVEYLKNDGNAFIQIPIINEPGWTKEICFQRNNTNASSYTTPYYCTDNVISSVWFKTTGMICNYKNKETTWSTVSAPVDTDITVRVSGASVWTSFDDTTRTASAGSNTYSTHVRLFKYGTTDTRGGIFSIKYFKIWNANNELVLDLIPVRIGDIGYMYDKIQKKLYDNYNTDGNFIVGPDKTYYKRVEYIQSSGGSISQFIDTGINLRQILSTEIDFSATSTSSITAESAVLGTSTPKYQLCVNSDLSWATVPIDDSDKYSISWITPGNISANVRYTPVVRNLVAQNSDETIYIFAKSNGTSFTSNFKSLRVYSCKIVGDDGTVLREFIPVRSKDNRGYLYDRVSHKIFGNGNSSSGHFSVGPDVTYDSELEYLESTGTQYINTGITCNTAYKLEVEAYTLARTEAVLGARYSSNSKDHSFVYPSEGDYIRYTCGGTGSTQRYLHPLTLSEWHKFTGVVGKFYVDDVLVKTLSSPASITQNLAYYLFAMNTNGTTSNLGAKRIRRCRIWNGDALILDLIPVVKNEVGYMYDSISGNYLGNVGTGDFTLGSVIVDQ